MRLEKKCHDLLKTPKTTGSWDEMLEFFQTMEEIIQNPKTC